jgi:hypothetical protein
MAKKKKHRKEADVDKPRKSVTAIGEHVLDRLYS